MVSKVIGLNGFLSGICLVGFETSLFLMFFVWFALVYFYCKILYSKCYLPINSVILEQKSPGSEIVITKDILGLRLRSCFCF